MTTTIRSRRTLCFRAALFLPLAALAPTALSAQGTDFQWRGRIAQGRAIEIKGVNGGLYATAASGDQIEVTARKRARKSDPDEVTFQVLEHGDGVTICAVYPGRSGRDNECRPGEGGRMETRNNDVEVEFTVRVPAGVRFVGRTVNGAVEVESLTGDVVAHTVNGQIQLSTLGLATARTVNGSITASIGKADWKGTLDFSTVNGGITVELPPSVAAEVRARTTNGSITTDFPLQVQGRFTPRRIEGTIGDGGRELNLATVNGSIRLRKRSVS
jgi:hypothetical protein